MKKDDIKNLKIKREVLGALAIGYTLVVSSMIGSSIYRDYSSNWGKKKDTNFEKITEYDTEGISNKFLIRLLKDKKESEIVEKEIVEVDKDSIEYNTRKEDVVFIKNTTNIYVDKDTESEKVGKILEGRNLKYLDNDDEWYQIDYYGCHGYISKSDGIKVTKDVMKYPMIEKGYLTADSKIYADKELTYELADLKRLEFLEIYKDTENSYLVSTIDGIGYVPKDNIETIEGDLAVVDISNQEVNIYEDDVRILSYPTVTGCIRNGTVSDEGYFTIFLKRGRCSFSGVTVDFMLNYNNGEGIHDAFRWRKMEEFGGDTYINSGSHGCINSPEYIIPLVYSTLDVGDKVLVKE